LGLPDADAVETQNDIWPLKSKEDNVIPGFEYSTEEVGEQVALLNVFFTTLMLMLVECR